MNTLPFTCCTQEGNLFSGIRFQESSFVSLILSLSSALFTLFVFLCITSFTLTAQNNVGIDQPNPQEKLDINGAIKIGTTANNNVGTIRYDNGDFEGRTAGGWQSLTQSTNIWSLDGNNTYFNTGQVGINHDFTEFLGFYPLIVEGDIGMIPEIGSTTTGMYFQHSGLITPGGGGYAGLTHEHEIDGQDLLSLFSNGGAIEVSTGNNMAEMTFRNAKVGIHTNLPDTRLEIEDLDNAASLRLTGNFSSMMQFKTELVNAANFEMGVNGNYFDFISNPNNDFTGLNEFLMSLHIPTGNFGVGELSPQTRLHITSPTENDGTTAALRIEHESNGQAMLLDGNEIDATVNDLYLNNNASGNVILANGGGDVGIGTSTPDALLNIEDSTLDPTTLRLTDVEKNLIEFVTTEPAWADWTLQHNGQALHFINDTGAGISATDFATTIYSGGYLGVRDTWPTHNLVVNGDAAKPGGGSWEVYSDRRLKTDINPYKDGLASLLKIKPVTFRYNGKLNLSADKEYVGIIAQEIQQIAPYMVHEKTRPDPSLSKEEADFLSFDGSALPFMLINAVQEQQGIIETQQTQLEQQQKEIDALKQMVQQLMSQER